MSNEAFSVILFITIVTIAGAIGVNAMMIAFENFAKMIRGDK